MKWNKIKTSEDYPPEGQEVWVMSHYQYWNGKKKAHPAIYCGMQKTAIVNNIKRNKQGQVPMWEMFGIVNPAVMLAWTKLIAPPEYERE